MASGATGKAKSAMGKQMGKTAKSKFFKYLFVVFLLGVISAAVGFIPSEYLSPRSIHALLCGLLIVFGIIHIHQMNARFSWAAQDILQAELIFTIIVSIVGAIGFMIGFYVADYFRDEYFMSTSYAGLMTTAFLVISLPWLLDRTFKYAVSIPPALYKPWIYPSKPLIPDPDSIDPSKFAVVTFVFPTRVDNEANTNHGGKAPYQLKLGDYFYLFMQEWNHKYPGKEIQYLDTENRPFGWYFSIKDKWWQSKRYLDPDFTILQNNIQLNQVIKTERFIQ